MTCFFFFLGLGFQSYTSPSEIFNMDQADHVVVAASGGFASQIFGVFLDRSA